MAPIRVVIPAEYNHLRCSSSDNRFHRHAHAVELAREGVAVNIIQRQLGHTDLGTTSTYLQGIDPPEIIDAITSRRAPMISMTAGLSL